MNSTIYIPNIDLYNLDRKKDILKNIYGETIDMLSEVEINIRFNKIMSREIQDIEKDVQDIS